MLGRGAIFIWIFTADYHTHTRYSHGSGTVEENVRAALRQGLESVGIADHGPANWRHIGIKRVSDYDRLIQDVERAREKYCEIKILAGAEANLISYDGEIDVPEEYIWCLDQILVGFHTMIIPKSWSDGWRFVRSSLAVGLLGRERYLQALKANTEALIAAVRRYPVKIITHPGLKIAVDGRELANACAERGVSLEINARHGVKSAGFIRAAAESAVTFVLSSDAHSPGEVGRLQPAAVAAQRAGLPVSRIINARET